MIALFALLALQTTAEQRCFDLSKGVGLLQSITQFKTKSALKTKVTK